MSRRFGWPLAARAAALVVLACLPVVSGCTPVPAWERSRLAHPTMKPKSSVGTAEGHLHEVQEGSTGGADSEGGGCGCN
jgi:hypothetical protein